jgi:predicted acylesterase/phospholipase RssA
MCLPVLAPPQVRGHEILIDGSLVDNLPVGAMAELGEGPVIAVDVKPTSERPQTSLRGAASITDDDTRIQAESNGPSPAGQQTAMTPSLAETLTRVLLLGSANTSEAATRHADVVIRPRVEGVGLLEFHQLDAARDAGRTAAQVWLEEGSGLGVGLL